MLNLRHFSYASDFSPVEEGCGCTCCRPAEDGGLGVTRAYIHHLTAKETAGAHLLTMHNVHYQMSLMRSVRTAIIEDRYPDFLRDFFNKRHPAKDYPGWAVEALAGVGVELF